MPAASFVKTLLPSEWIALRSAHEKRVDPWVTPRLERAALGLKHPVDDFLFEYYPNRPSLLRRWHPGLGYALLGDEAESYLGIPGYIATRHGIRVEPLPEKRRPFVQWLAEFLESTANRAPFFGCHGLHEWAMVYKTGEVRHASQPLRLSSQEIALVVESLPVRCSHYDAFRFFTPEAKPLNRLQPTRETSLNLEQPACLHANMDLYKWAFKLASWCPSELIADTFELARDIRELDMRASPYDLNSHGYSPIAIETPEGRAQYEKYQRMFAERARPLRQRLKSLCDSLLA
ncbi:MAG: 3-methyladenine DNA glycosylase [bacterium]